MTKEERAYDGICNIIEGLKRKDDKIDVKVLRQLKNECDSLSSFKEKNS